MFYYCKICNNSLLLSYTYSFGLPLKFQKYYKCLLCKEYGLLTRQVNNILEICEYIYNVNLIARFDEEAILIYKNCEIEKNIYKFPPLSSQLTYELCQKWINKLSNLICFQ